MIKVSVIETPRVSTSALWTRGGVRLLLKNGLRGSGLVLSNLLSRRRRKRVSRLSRSRYFSTTTTVICTHQHRGVLQVLKGLSSSLLIRIALPTHKVLDAWWGVVGNSVRYEVENYELRVTIHHDRWRALIRKSDEALGWSAIRTQQGDVVNIVYTSLSKLIR